MKQTVALLVFIGVILGFILPFWLQNLVIIASVICLIAFIHNSDGPEGANQFWWVKFAGAFYGLSLSGGFLIAQFILYCHK